MHISCIRKLHFCSGHRVMGHENKCANLHGHNYQIELEAESILTKEELDTVGRVVDFSVIKATYDPWIQREWDHGFILNKEDTEAINRISGFAVGPNQTQKIFLLDSNPTAENLGVFLLTYHLFVQVLAQYGVRIKSVVVHETPNCFAKVTQESPYVRRE